MLLVPTTMLSNRGLVTYNQHRLRIPLDTPQSEVSLTPFNSSCFNCQLEGGA